MPRPVASLRNLIGATRRQLLFALNIYALTYALHCAAPVLVEGRMLLRTLPQIAFEPAVDLFYSMNLMLWIGSWFFASALAARVLPRDRLGNATMLAIFISGALGTLGALREFVCHMQEWDYSPHLLRAQMRISEALYEVVFYQSSLTSFKVWMALFSGLLPLLALVSLAVITIGATRTVTYFSSSDEIDPSRLSGRSTH